MCVSAGCQFDGNIVDYVRLVSENKCSHFIDYPILIAILTLYQSLFRKIFIHFLIVFI